MSMYDTLWVWDGKSTWIDATPSRSETRFAAPEAKLNKDLVKLHATRGFIAKLGSSVVGPPEGPPSAEDRAYVLGFVPRLTVIAAPPADWKVQRITDNGAKKFYRYHVTGVLLTSDPPESFSWDVPDVDNPRFDLSEAERIEYEENADG